MKKTLILAIFSVLMFSGFSPAYALNSCYTFNTDLRIGSTGSDVEALHSILSKEGFNRSSQYWQFNQNLQTYTEETASLVTAFQEKYKSEILTPMGLSHGTGFVGAYTRSKLNTLSTNCGTQSGYVPVISNFVSSSQLRVGETGTWSLNATDPQSGPLYYSVIWGDEFYAYSGYNSVNPSLSQTYYNAQQATFTHTYNNPGTYNVKFKVRDTQGFEAEVSGTVYVSYNSTGGSSNDVRVTSPNSNVVWQASTYQTISWTLPNVQYFAAQAVDINLIPQNNNGYINQGSTCPVGNTCAYTGNSYSYYNQPYYASTYNLARSIYGTSYSWYVGNTTNYWTTIPAGNYLVEVCLAGTNTCDRSDIPFTLTR